MSTNSVVKTFDGLKDGRTRLLPRDPSFPLQPTQFLFVWRLMPTAYKGLLTLIRKELAPVMQRPLGNAHLAPPAPEICHSRGLIARLPV